MCSDKRKDDGSFVQTPNETVCMNKHFGSFFTSFPFSPAPLVFWTAGSTRQATLPAMRALSSVRISGGGCQQTTRMAVYAWCVGEGRQGEKSNNWTINLRLPPAHPKVE